MGPTARASFGNDQQDSTCRRQCPGTAWRYKQQEGPGTRSLCACRQRERGQCASRWLLKCNESCRGQRSSLVYSPLVWVIPILLCSGSPSYKRLAGVWQLVQSGQCLENMGADPCLGLGLSLPVGAQAWSAQRSHCEGLGDIVYLFGYAGERTFCLFWQACVWRHRSRHGL